MRRLFIPWWFLAKCPHLAEKTLPQKVSQTKWVNSHWCKKFCKEDLALFQFLFTFYFMIFLELQKSCKNSTKNSLIPLNLAFLKKKKLELIYNVVLVLGVQHSDSGPLSVNLLCSSTMIIRLRSQQCLMPQTFF